MTYYSTELEKQTANTFRRILKELGFTFETSEAGNLIHFEVLCTPVEVNQLNKVSSGC